MPTSAEHFLNSAGRVSDYLSTRAEPAIYAPTLTDEITTEVIVIGGGFTGLSCALTLAQSGLRPVLLEAKEIGWGASGRAWGQVAAAAKFMPAQVERDFPPGIARRINLAAETAPDVVFGLVKRHGIQCDAVRTGNIIAAHNPDKAQWVSQTARDLQARGYPVHLLDSKQTKDYTGSSRYRSALFDERGGALNPLGYARGLARVAHQAGCDIYLNSPLVALHKLDKGWRVETPHGGVTARQVVIATGVFTGDLLNSGSAREIIPVRAYQAISQPLTQEVLQTLLPGGQPFNDTRRMFSGVRIWPDGRLHVGLDGPLFEANAEGWLKGASQRLKMMFPQLPELRWDYHWAGWVDMTVDHYPRLHRLATGVFTAYGFSGRGVAIGTLMGRDLANLVLEKDEQHLVHPLSSVKPLWYHTFYQPLVQALTARYRLEDRLNDARYGRTEPELNP